MTRMRGNVYSILSLALNSTVAIAASDTTPQRAWFDAEIAASERIPDLAGWSIAYVEKIYPNLTHEEAEALRSQIANKPDHPRIADLETYDQYVESREPYSIHLRLFSGGEGRWRWCLSYPDSYWDTAICPQGAWLLTAKSIRVFTPDDPASHAAKKRLSMLIPQISRFLHGGLGIAKTSNLQFARFESLSNGRWRAIGTLADKPSTSYAHVFEGRWDQALGRGFVEVATVYHNGYPGPIVERERYSDWKYSDDTERWIAHRIERHDHRGMLGRTFEVESIAANPLPLEQLIAVPEMNGNDAIRGPLKVAEVADLRTSQYTALDEDGAFTHGFITPADGTPPTSAWRLAGWGTLATLPVAVLFVARKRMTR